MQATRLNNEVKRELGKFHTERWEEKMTECNLDVNKAYILIKKLRNETPKTPHLQRDNAIAHLDEEEEKTLARSLQRQFMINQIDNDTIAEDSYEGYNSTD